ncbi:unnamed protein product [Bursaphelenchus okinawaensis]|uniref:Uncharacterized protein n=1 Tax=Bursaphelenchus okinawaensis TaxID=465554 RepID=A0A811L9F7_9BILA|nr:unnamed protein product [Bursaphelenchus okinawaensis]CAG9120260.1 unnamed protein product [Bursaphelenchus okinawaensis]
MKKDSLEPEDFEDNLQLHSKCGVHVQLLYFIASIVCVVFDLLAVVLLLVLFMYPEFHRKSVVYSQLLQYYDRTRPYSYHLVYNGVLFFWVFLFFAHILCIGVGLFGVKLRRPYLMLPQISLLVVRLGIFIVLFFGLITINFVGSEVVILATMLICLFGIVSGLYLMASVFCFRYVREKHLMIQKILASAKSVHFKDKKRKK